MRAMRTYAKKKECVNAPVGPFATFSHCACGYNIRNELISAAKLVGGDDPGAPQSRTSTTEYAYHYDDIGNRLTSLDLDTNRIQHRQYGFFLKLRKALDKEPGQ